MYSFNNLLFITMIGAIIRFSIQHKLLIGLLMVGLIAGGIFSLTRLPIDAVPDITNNQVQVVTVSTSLAPQEVEQFITYPVEVAMANIPDVIEIRSISRFGLSVVTIVFENDMPILDARQFVKEQIGVAQQDIPAYLGTPTLMPITTGLGEIYQYVLQVEPGYESEYGPMELRTIQDWIVKRQLAGTRGIIEISSFGGFLKQYEVAIDPLLLQNHALTLTDVFEALSRNNQNTGGSYIEKNTAAYYIRTEGVVQHLDDIRQMVVATRQGIPVLIQDIGKVQFGSPKRFGAMTMDGKGEAVGGITLMLKGANSSEAIQEVHSRIEEVKKSLPEGVSLYPYLDRSVLVGKTINTVEKNLLEGGLIVILVLVILLGDLRAGLIVASVIPLAMLFAIIMMNQFHVSANLMSLGAIDFGIVVDGAVIVVEGVLHGLVAYHAGKVLSQAEMDQIVGDSASRLFRSAVFGVFIILVVFVPIMTLTGIEGKMFRPMALTFSFAVLGALILSLTYVPMMAAWVLPKKIKTHEGWSGRLVGLLQNLYRPVLKKAISFPYATLGLALALLILAGVTFNGLGAVFIPTLEEGDLAMQMTIQPGSSLQESVRASTKAERILLKEFPEVKHVVSKIGTAEVPTDPMAIEDADIMIILEEKELWTRAKTREELVEKMKAALSVVVGASFEFTQPIQLRFNELMTGAKTDIAIKIFGEDTEVLYDLAQEAAGLLEDIPGAGDVKVDQTEGLPQLMVDFHRGKIAEYGLDIETLNDLIRTAYAGESAGVVFENERKFDLVVRLDAPSRNNLDLSRLYATTPSGQQVPLSEFASVKYTEGPMQISREDTRRRINIGVNVRNRDIASLVEEIQLTLESQLQLPPGYTVKYGGEFENLRKAQQRLSIAVPAALMMIFLLLYFTFGQLSYALMIFSAVPLSAIGGVFALWLRDMPFSISAGVGFIALFGVAVLNGIVLISEFNRLRKEEGLEDLEEVVQRGALVRLRPVIMTATVAAMGFLPMALSSSNGAEVQRPLATVVIGGLITATLLTLFVLPVLYLIINRRSKGRKPMVATAAITLFLFMGVQALPAQTSWPLDSVLQHTYQHHPELARARLMVNKGELTPSALRNVPTTSLGFQYGQINTPRNDWQFTVGQSLGNPFALARQRQAGQAELQLRTSEEALLRHQIDYEVRRLWQQWQYTREVLDLIDAQVDLYETLNRRSRQQLEAGAVSKLAQTFIQNQLTGLRQQQVSLEVQHRQVYRELIQQSFIPEGVSPSREDLAPLALPLVPDPGPDPLLLSPAQDQVTLATAYVGLAQRKLLPELSVGYFLQRILPDKGLQGVQLGVSVPLWNRPQKARIAQARLDAHMAEQSLLAQRHFLDQETALTNERLQALATQLDQQGGQLLEQAQSLRQLAQQQWQSGEIDYFNYVQSITLAFQNERTYLDLLNQYNQQVIYWRFLHP